VFDGSSGSSPSRSSCDAVLCVAKNKKGVITKVNIRGAACKGKESVGDPSVLLGLPTTTTSPTTTTTLSPLAAAGPRIVDSAGNEVGWLTSVSGGGVWALRTIDDQATAFPMSSFGPGFTSSGTFLIDDFQYQFAHQGTQCVGDRFSEFTTTDLLPNNDLLRIVIPSADGKSGYLITPEVTEVSTGFYSQDNFKFECALVVPPTVTCDNEAGAVVTPVGEAFPCHPNTVFPTDPTTQCTCIRCCVTREVQPPDSPISLYRLQTVDLGLGNSTPPFKIE